MDTKKLRQKILDLAIRGKLVPQDPNDEPASVLLERIRAEKERLIKEGKIKRSKKSASDDEIEAPFEIPESWEWCRLNEVGEIVTGGTPPKEHKEYYGGNMPFFKPTDLEQGINTYSSIDTLTKEGFAVARKIPANSILVTCIGATIGKTGLIRTEGACNQQINAVITYTSIISEFIYYICVSNYMQTCIIEKASATTLPILNKNHFSEILIPLSPKEEQKRIVDEVERWFTLIDELESNEGDLLKIIDKVKSKILDLAIHGKLVPQDPNDEPAYVLLQKIREEKQQLVKAGKLKKKDLIEAPISEDEIPFEIPESWEWCRIKSIFSMQAGKNVTSADISNEKNGIFKYPCYGGNGLRGYVKSYNTEGIFPLVGRQGALCGNINLANGKFWATEHAVVTDGFGMTGYEWQYYFLIALNLNQYATATAQPGLAVSNIIEVLIPLPPLAEQKRIVAKIEQLLGEIDKLKK